MDQIYERLCKRIRLVRTANEDTAYFLGEQIGYTERQVYNIEKCKSAPSFFFVAEIAKYYGLSLDCLLYGTDDEFESELLRGEVAA